MWNAESVWETGAARTVEPANGTEAVCGEDEEGMGRLVEGDLYVKPRLAVRGLMMMKRQT